MFVVRNNKCTHVYFVQSWQNSCHQDQCSVWFLFLLILAETLNKLKAQSRVLSYFDLGCHKSIISRLWWRKNVKLKAESLNMSAGSLRVKVFYDKLYLLSYTICTADRVSNWCTWVPGYLCCYLMKPVKLLGQTRTFNMPYFLAQT